jgi:hypothetical protein
LKIPFVLFSLPGRNFVPLIIFCGCKWKLLKVREEEIQREAWWGPGRSWKLRACVFAPRVLLKPMGRGKQGDSQPIINEWGGA